MADDQLDLFPREVVCAGCKKPWIAGHICPTPPHPWWKKT